MKFRPKIAHLSLLLVLGFHSLSGLAETIPDCALGVVRVEMLTEKVAQFKSYLEMRSAFPILIVLDQIDHDNTSVLRVTSIQNSIPDEFNIAGTIKNMVTSLPNSLGVKMITAEYCSEGNWPSFDSLSNVGTIGH